MPVLKLVGRGPLFTPSLANVTKTEQRVFQAHVGIARAEERSGKGGWTDWRKRNTR